jgi:serine O-acetyltransferase
MAAKVMSAADKWRAVLLLPFAWAIGVSDQKEMIEADVRRWLSAFNAQEGGHGLHSLLYAFTEFRSLVYWRLQCGNPAGALLARVMRKLWRPTEGLLISTEQIGPGLFIAHGYGTTLAAERIGSNCYVHQGVTIGWDYRSRRSPVIGNDVFVGAGAVILGGVTIGDNAKIGANSVVLSDVPTGATAVGAPARLCGTAPGPEPASAPAERSGDRSRRRPHRARAGGR